MRTDIFEFHDGDKVRRIDPFVALKALHYYARLAKQDFNDLYRRSGLADPAENFEPWLALLPITAAAFGVPMFHPDTGEGLTADRLDAILDSFMEFKKKVPPASVTSPTSPTPTA